MKFLSRVDTLRYSDSVNHSSWSLRSVTKKGVYSMGGRAGSKNSGRVPEVQMRLNSSMIGITSLTATSSSNQEPGITVTLVPTVQIDKYGRPYVDPEYDAMGEPE
jgi:hypothetical protein